MQNYRAKLRKHENVELDFDFWSDMANKAPVSFEAMRLAVINELIDSSPVEKREQLRRFQWRIDQERRLARTPMAACLRLSQMMWHSVLGENGLLDRAEELSEFLQNRPMIRPKSSCKSGRVLSFRYPVERASSRSD